MLKISYGPIPGTILKSIIGVDLYIVTISFNMSRSSTGAQRSTIEELVTLEPAGACKKATNLPRKSSSSASLACEKAHESNAKAAEKSF